MRPLPPAVMNETFEPDDALSEWVMDTFITPGGELAKSGIGPDRKNLHGATPRSRPSR